MFFQETGFDRFVRKAALGLAIANLVFVCILVFLTVSPEQVKLIKMFTVGVALLALITCVHELYETTWSIFGVALSTVTIISILFTAIWR